MDEPEKGFRRTETPQEQAPSPLWALVSVVTLVKEGLIG